MAKPVAVLSAQAEPGTSTHVHAAADASSGGTVGAASCVPASSGGGASDGGDAALRLGVLVLSMLCVGHRSIGRGIDGGRLRPRRTTGTRQQGGRPRDTGGDVFIADALHHRTPGASVHALGSRPRVRGERRGGDLAREEDPEVPYPIDELVLSTTKREGRQVDDGCTMLS